MASITVQQVRVLDNPSTFLADFKFEITFECIAPISDGACLPVWPVRVVLRGSGGDVVR